MDSLTIADTIKYFDTVSVIDTLTVKTFSDAPSFWQISLEIGKIIVPIVAVFIAAWKAFQYGLKKDRISEKEKEERKYKTLKSHILFSCKELIKATQSQINYINEFKDQFKSNQVDIKQIQINSSFDIDNFNATPRLDYYKLFIEQSKQSEFEKSKAFSNFNFSLKVTKHVSENLVSDMNKYRNRVNQLGDQYNIFSSEVRNIINYHIDSKPVPGFTPELLELNKTLNTDKLEDIYYMITKFYLPLLDLAKKHRILAFIQTIPDILSLLKQLEGSKTQYYNIYNTFVEQMQLSIEELKGVISFFDSEK